MAYLGFDVGGSSVKYALVSDEGVLEKKGKFNTPDNLEDFYKQLKKAAESLRQGETIEGAAFSLPGAVDNQKGVIGGSSAIPFIHDFPIKKDLEELLELPVSMENDANCAALGEIWLGAAKGKEDVIFLVIGSGVGGAVVKDQRIHHGPNLHGGEFGFMVMDDNYHTLSELASTGGMANRLAELKGVEEGSFNGIQAFEMREAGDADAKKAIDDMYEYLARAIYNLQYSYDPEVFVIGGAISERPDLTDILNERIEEIMDVVKIARVVPQVRPAQFGNDANILGAVFNFKQNQRK